MEGIAVAEAQRMGIPIVAVVDTNCNPDGIDYPIPGNDDAIRAITLFTQIIANAVVEADNEVGLRIIENLESEDENMEELMTDASIKEEDQEIDIASYTEKQPAHKDDLEPEDDDLHVDIVKAYGEDV
jgi:small subunit ribosomal protein S2